MPTSHSRTPASPVAASTTGGATPLPKVEDVAWHLLDASSAIAAVNGEPDGLASDTAADRALQVGPNSLVDRGSKRPRTILWEQLSAVMVVILIGAAALSFALGKNLEGAAIGAIVVLFVLLGFIQEYRAEQAIAALRRMAVPQVRALRDGRPTEIPAVDLVPGDVVLLEAGNVVPADLRLLETANLRIQEAALTGESEAVDKLSAALETRELPLGDRHNMAFAGTQVTHGRAKGLVVATGMDTELGRIADLLQDVSSGPTPLQRRLDHVGKQLAAAGGAVALVVVAIGALGGEPLADLVLTAISVAVAVIPEGLPAVVTFALAIGAQRMLRRNALIRKLPAVETLGSVTVICSDKTGTLTQNRMTVTVIDVANRRTDFDPSANTDPESRPEALTLALIGAALCNDAAAELTDEGDLSTIGDPTETALIVAAHEAGLDLEHLRTTAPRIAEVPFDSTRKRMTTVHRLDREAESNPSLSALDQRMDGAPVAFVKGSVDGLIPLISHVWDDDGPTPVTDDWLARLELANDSLAEGGMRVLGIACRKLDSDTPDQPSPPADQIERDLILLGMIGIIDPPRPEVADAVSVCLNAGIRPVMITGDHPLTASAIASDIGLPRAASVLTGIELDRIDDDELDARVGSTSVFARVSPEHKLRIVNSLRRTGQVVAMTGDGVNDAPALKQADIGVAMGITGTDVSKEAADMVLRDDNFTTIVASVEEGRVIYDNLRRFVKFAVAGNIGKIAVMVLWPVPFLLTGQKLDVTVALVPLQLLWLNLMTDGLLGLSMGMEPAEPGVMRRPPGDPNAGIWSGGLGREAAWVGAFIGFCALGIGYAYHETGRPQWQTMIFTSLAFLQVFQALGTRSTTESLRSIGWASNRLMIAIIALVVGLQVAALYTPLATFLDVEPLSAADLAVCVAAGGLLLTVMEFVKAARRRRMVSPSPRTLASR